ncbi:MAG TPA: hypothetical protein VKA60_18645 [Blastocatellia bacterium]|nr:hypothetical protein [Blastocatellia bacterium]
MRHWLVVFALMTITVLSLAQDKEKEKAKEGGSRLVYADFEQLKDGRPVSARGGLVLLSGYQENPAIQVTFTNSDKPWPQSPAVVPAAQNHSQLVFYSFRIPAPNQWAGVTLEIRGLPDKDGKQVAEDLSAYKYISVDVQAQGTNAMRAELVSKDNGMTIGDGQQHSFPFNLGTGMHTYRLELKKFAQPNWDNVTKVDVKDLLKKLTCVRFTTYAIPSNGQIVIDNVAFEK